MGEHDGVAGGEDAVCGGAATARTTAQGSGATGRLAARWLRGFCEPSLRVAVSIMAHPPGVEPQYFLKKLWYVFPPYSTHFPGIDSKNCRVFLSMGFGTSGGALPVNAFSKTSSSVPGGS